MAKLSKNLVIVGAKRTAFGTLSGSLKGISAIDLGVIAAKAALAQSGVAVADIGHVIAGNVMQTSPDAIYCARHVGLKAGLPITTPAAARAPSIPTSRPRTSTLLRAKARPSRTLCTTVGGTCPARDLGRRHREHDAGAARAARRTRRLGVRQIARGRRLAVGGSHG